jgi:RNA polymerase sigma-70 factor (ECF subfamily)
VESDEHLYERLRAGAMDAFDLLYARYERPLYGFIRAYVGDGDAADAFHESFLEVLAGRPLDLRRGSLRAWLYTVARNECLNRLRTRERAARAGERVDVPLPPATVDEQLDARSADVALRGAVDKLPRPLAELFQLRTAGLSYDEMARVLSVPVGTVRSRMHELVSQLRKEMHPWTAE